MFQLYRDGLDDLLFEKKKKKKGGDDEPKGPLKITLAEHSPTGLVQVRFLGLLRTIFYWCRHALVAG